MLEFKNVDILIEDKKILENISFKLEDNKRISILGMTGSGKTLLTKSIVRTNEKIKIKGDILIDNERITDRNYIKYRGYVSYIYQNATSVLNPTLKISTQITEHIIRHLKVNKKKAYEIGLSVLKKVGIDNIEERMGNYPYMFSGGECQRILIAIAISINPKILICDEITTSLDILNKIKILDLILKLQEEYKFSLIYISHDISTVLKMSNSILVLDNKKAIYCDKKEDILKIDIVKKIYNSTMRLL